MAAPAFDPDQLKAVGVDTNTVVAAGAGSGKTTVLAGRFLRLVREGAKIPAILTLTFTRKAAAEMYTRIHHLLVAHADEPAVREQLSLFDQAQISTLDSFCARLARNDAARFGLPLSFAIDQETLVKSADSFALEFILEHHRNPALQELIAANGFEPVWKEFFARYAVQELNITEASRHVDDFLNQEETCRREATEIFARLDSLYASIGDTVRSAGEKKSAILKDAGKSAAQWTDTKNLLAQEDWPELMRLAAVKPYRKPSSNAKDPDLLILREHLEVLLPLGERALSLVSVLHQREIYAGIMELMDAFALRWSDHKRRQGIVSFGDVVAMAVTLLKENRDLRNFYKEQFSHIMIDEFQDNNEVQKELLYLLAERRDRCTEGIPEPEDLAASKLFFVGDEKQSIYRFRGADVSVFKRLSRELGGGSIELGTNYRSDPRLIGFFNRFFPRVFDTGESPEEFEAEFRPLKGRPEEPGTPPPEIRLHYLTDDEDAPEEETLRAVESEAFEAARIISEAVAGGGLRLHHDGETRPPYYSDFALLLRSTGNQIVYEGMFRRFGIPYTTENIRTLFLEAPANDIYAALQTALYPEDRSAYAVFLRSFFVNLEDETLIAKLMEDSAPFSGDTGTMPPEEREKYLGGETIYSTLRSMIDRVPHRDVLRYLWHEGGYRYNLLKDPAYHGYLEFYEYLVSLADRSWDAGESMALFLDFLRDNLGDYKKLEEIEILRDRQEGVRIMTIHKSKGLEFPIVLLGSAGQGSADNGKRSPYYRDREYGLTINLNIDGPNGRGRPNPFYEKSRDEASRQEAAELKRLLYVACTRAEAHLIMLGASPQRKSSTVPSLLDLIFTGFDCSPDAPDPEAVTLFPPLTRQLLRTVSQRSQKKSRIEEFRSLLNGPPFTMPPAGGPVSVSMLNHAAAARLPESAGVALPSLPVDELISDAEDRFGTLVHRTLELLITGRGGSPEESLFPDLPREKLDTLIAAAEKLARGFWESPQRRELIPDGAPVRSEAPFTLSLEPLLPDSLPDPPSPPNSRTGYLTDGVIDLFADLGDRVVCIDFKTNRFRTEGEYAMQMWLYRQALEKLTGKPAESYLLYLREGSPRRETTKFSPHELAELLQNLKDGTEAEE